MIRALRAEFAKLKRARMPLWTLLTVCGYGVISATMTSALLRPEAATKIGASGGAFAKAAAAGLYHSNWANYLRFNQQGIAGAWGILLFGLVAAYLFGREFSEGTAKNMLTLPLRREWFVLAKFVVLAVWVLALTLLSVAAQVAFGALLKLDGFSWSLVRTCLVDSLRVSSLLFLTLPIVGWLGMLGRGYLPPMLFSGLMQGATTALVVTKWAAWFPWSMPVLLVGASWFPVANPQKLVASSWMVALGVFVGGIGLLFWQIDHADNAQ